MKWSNRVQIITGQTCFHIAMHLSVVVFLIWGWKHQLLSEVSAGLVAAYVIVLVAMMVTQRIARLRLIGDYLEEASTTYYFGAAMLTLFLLSRVVHNPLLVGALGVVMLVGPALISLLAKEPVRHTENKRS
ncbi:MULTISPECIES: YbhQ family protein [Tatumella]|uniref:Putative inner membrane protein n=1 Tax=Tatumella ptyseos ATCC 33301 TaxID=1005995 RepID=A0A085JC70_9GAMM|nr:MULTISPECIES: YbhQ family protein [Tatumella]KFD18066.1 putative inner membrane protein [Tatumella ptyseos ATCC 33301]